MKKILALTIKLAFFLTLLVYVTECASSYNDAFKLKDKKKSQSSSNSSNNNTGAIDIDFENLSDTVGSVSLVNYKISDSNAVSKTNNADNYVDSGENGIDIAIYNASNTTMDDISIVLIPNKTSENYIVSSNYPYLSNYYSIGAFCYKSGTSYQNSI